MNVSPGSTSLVDSVPTTVFQGTFSGTVVVERSTFVGCSLTSVIASVKPAVTGVLPASEVSATLTVTA